MASLEETRENIARVKEELTIQRVILRSLDDSGVTDENVRQRVEQEITALKDQLRDLMICTLFVQLNNAPFHTPAANSLFANGFFSSDVVAERHHMVYNSHVGSQTSNTMSGK